MSDTTDLIGDLAGFAQLLRAGGLVVEVPRVTTALRALRAYNPLGVDDIYWATRLTMCARHENVPAFDRAYTAWFGVPPPAAEAAPSWAVDASQPVPASEPSDDDAAAETAAAVLLAGLAERLAPPSPLTLREADRAEVRAYIQALTAAAPRRRTRRYGSGGQATIDVPRTARSMMRHSGEPVDLRYRKRLDTRRRCVLLLDVSRSMREHRGMLLRFAFATVAVAPTTTEVFTIGTRLDRITGELRRHDPQVAMQALAARQLDWDGGTRLRDTITAFARLWGDRRELRSADLVLVSDGWELATPAPFIAQIRRLARLAHRVIWVDPAAGDATYAPEAPALVGSLPYVQLAAGNDATALRALAGILTCPACGARCPAHRDIRAWIAAS